MSLDLIKLEKKVAAKVRRFFDCCAHRASTSFGLPA